MAGLLDFFQQDPDKQAALKQGLLNMGIQMLAGGRQELGTSLGHGLGAGVSVYQKQIDDMKKKQAMQNVFRSAYGQPPAQSPAVMKPQESAAPAAPMYGGKAPLLSMDYANGSDLSQSQSQPQQEQAPAPSPAPQFNRDAFFRAAFENPDAGYTDTALKYMVSPGSSQDGRTSEIKNYEFAQSLPEDQRKAFLAGHGSSGMPSSVQEYEYLKRLEASGDTEGIKQFYALKRATQWQDFGGYKAPILPDGSVGAPVNKGLAPQELPSVLAAQEEAKARAKAGVEQQSNISTRQQKLSTDAQSIDSLVASADKLLNDATGSTAGAGVAYGKGLVGVSDASTQANAALNVLGGQLVSKIPRMEGPQSDADVKMYKQMAGRVADPTVPVEDRRAALRTLQSITRQYAQSSPSAASPAQTKQISGTYKDPYTVTNDADYNSVPKGKYYKAPDGSIRMRK